MSKRNRIIIILSVILLVAAIMFIVLSFVLSGADILAWFSSKWAMWFYTFAIIDVLVIVSVLVVDKINKL